jgi:hypothetical protein
MLNCLCCGSVALASYIERDAGDWVVSCENCGAKNIVVLAKDIQMALIEVVGWRE